MRERGGWKVVATLLLLFAAVDVLVPGLCIAESEDAPQLQSRSHGATVTNIDVDGQHNDCFCCCPHVIPEWQQGLGSLVSVVDDATPVLAARADLSPASLYHPPRTRRP